MKADGTLDLNSIAFVPVQEQWNVPRATPVVKGAATLDGEWQTVTEGRSGWRAVVSPSHPDSVFLYNSRVACYRLVEVNLHDVAAK